MVTDAAGFFAGTLCNNGASIVRAASADIDPQKLGLGGARFAIESRSTRFGTRTESRTACAILGTNARAARSSAPRQSKARRRWPADRMRCGGR